MSGLLHSKTRLHLSVLGVLPPHPHLAPQKKNLTACTRVKPGYTFCCNRYNRGNKLNDTEAILWKQLFHECRFAR